MDLQQSRQIIQKLSRPYWTGVKIYIGVVVAIAIGIGIAFLTLKKNAAAGPFEFIVIPIVLLAFVAFGYLVLWSNAKSASEFTDLQIEQIEAGETIATWPNAIVGRIGLIYNERFWPWQRGYLLESVDFSPNASRLQFRFGLTTPAGIRREKSVDVPITEDLTEQAESVAQLLSDAVASGEPIHRFTEGKSIDA